MIVTVNGSRTELPAGATVETLVAALARGGGRGGRGVAVAVSGEVVPRGEWEQTLLREGSAVEVLTAVQGG